MKDIPRVGFICTGENALELSGAICCAGRLMRHFGENGYMTGGCYSCISPSKQISLLRDRITHMCACNDVVVTIGCEGFREGDVLPDIVNSLCTKELSYFAYKLSSDEYVDATNNKARKCPPSRATAAMFGRALILNFSSDVTSALGKANSLMSAIGFAMGNASNKVQPKSLKLDSLIVDYYSGRSFRE